MSFESRFELLKRINVTDVRWQGIPKPGSGATKCSAPHSGEVGRRNGEVERGGTAERAGAI